MIIDWMEDFIDYRGRMLRGSLLLLFILSSLSAERYDEELTVSRLPTGNILSHFRFVVSDVASKLTDDTYLFPPIMSDIVKKYGLSELSLTLGRGNWLSTKWGIPPQPATSQGATITAWLDDAKNDTEVDDRWSHLVTSLNGIFCTSLSAMYPAHSVKLNGEGKGRQWKEGVRQGRHGAIAEETVCTENLTPWRKLLPCKKTGLVSLLNPLRLYDSLFHSISLHLLLHCIDEKCLTPTWRLSLDATVVFDIRLRDRALDWSFERLFGRSISGHCPVADSTTLLVNDDYYTPLFDRPANATKIHSGRTFHVFDISSSSGNEVVHYKEKKVEVDNRILTESISVTAFLVGGEATRTGHIEYLVSREGGSPTSTILSSLSIMIPWYAEIHYGSVSITCVSQGQKYDGLISRRFIPSLARKRPASIDYRFELRGDSQCTVSMMYDRVFMRMSEYPSDANHGKYIPPAHLRIIDTSSHQSIIPGDEKALATKSDSSSSSISLYSRPILITLPVPDFSMPFNVEAFVCVVISLCFTPLLNITAYIMMPVGPKPPRPSRSRRAFRVFLYILTALALYAEMNQISPSQLMRYGRAAVNTVVKSAMDTVAPINHTMQITE